MPIPYLKKPRKNQSWRTNKRGYYAPRKNSLKTTRAKKKKSGKFKICK